MATRRRDPARRAVRTRDGVDFSPAAGPRVLHVMSGSDGADSCSYNRAELEKIRAELKSWGVREADDLQIKEYVPLLWVKHRLDEMLAKIDRLVARDGG